MTAGPPSLPGSSPAEMDIRGRWIVAAVLLSAALVRVVYLLHYFADVPYVDAPIVDSAFYDRWAQRVASGEGYGPMPYYMAPLYPYLLGVLYWITGRTPGLVIGLQAVLGVLNLYLVYRIGRRLFGHSAGLTAMVVALLYAPLMFLESKLLTETLSITVSLGTLFLLFRALERPLTRRFLAAGLALGIAVLVRSNALIFVGLLVAWIFLRILRHRGGIRPCHLAALVAGTVAIILPVTVRNAMVGRDLALVTTNAGIVFAQANHPDATGVASPLPGFSGRIEEQQHEEMARATKALGHQVSPSESSGYWMGKGLQFVVGHPLEFLRLLGRKLLWSVHDREARDVYNLDYEKDRIPMLGLLFLPFSVLAGLAVFGFLRGPRRGRRDADRTVLVLFVASIYLTLWIFAVSFRYRAPAAPVLAVFAGFGLLELGRVLWARRWRDAALSLSCVAVFLAVSRVPYPIPRVTAEAPTNLGSSFLKLGRTREAISCFRRALSLNPDFANAHYDLGLALERSGDLDGAVREYRAVVRLRPEHSEAHHNLATLLDRQGRYAQAIHEYRQALRIDPDQVVSHCNLAIALYETGDLNGAWREVEACRRLDGRLDPAFVQALRRRAPQPPGDVRNPPTQSRAG
ncbi:MAG: tetratricopeptide repeat protein, partial [Deltaproteobacteria bacterium]|nr:tetratricopeptide repeat protein [Deltaproteobacteria bacterium]